VNRDARYLGIGAAGQRLATRRVEGREAALGLGVVGPEVLGVLCRAGLVAQEIEVGVRATQGRPAEDRPAVLHRLLVGRGRPLLRLQEAGRPRVREAGAVLTKSE
jgi:hypothetical protein